MDRSDFLKLLGSVGVAVGLPVGSILGAREVEGGTDANSFSMMFGYMESKKFIEMGSIVDFNLTPELTPSLLGEDFVPTFPIGYDFNIEIEGGGVVGESLFLKLAGVVNDYRIVTDGREIDFGALLRSSSDVGGLEGPPRTDLCFSIVGSFS